MIVAQGTPAQEPQLKIERAGNKVTAMLAGPWTAEHASVERESEKLAGLIAAAAR